VPSAAEINFWNTLLRTPATVFDDRYPRVYLVMPFQYGFRYFVRFDICSTYFYDLGCVNTM